MYVCTGEENQYIYSSTGCRKLQCEIVQTIFIFHNKQYRWGGGDSITIVSHPHPPRQMLRGGEGGGPMYISGLVWLY